MSHLSNGNLSWWNPNEEVESKTGIFSEPVVIFHNAPEITDLSTLIGVPQTFIGNQLSTFGFVDESISASPISPFQQSAYPATFPQFSCNLESSILESPQSITHLNFTDQFKGECVDYPTFQSPKLKRPILPHLTLIQPDRRQFVTMNLSENVTNEQASSVDISIHEDENSSSQNSSPSSASDPSDGDNITPSTSADMFKQAHPSVTKSIGRPKRRQSLEEKEQRDRRRREKNRQAARRSRTRKRVQREQLENQIYELEVAYEILKNTVKEKDEVIRKLEIENKSLRKLDELK
ncbi:14970_t:CDS:1 [Acaulospora morrowiae]|uniref:14970_t:CDS:1 n=1 Tax=Acaulospora morrowiae TaxID=94023 RepID=A0A9N9BZ78_9GLOM|nr:14970_t:CDS:1 [Acaulospora morrowiae]